MKVATKCLPTNNTNHNNINIPTTNNNNNNSSGNNNNNNIHHNLNYVNHNNNINLNASRQYTSNTSTTQSWPVIHRNSNHYDFEALLYLNHLWKDENSSSSDNTSYNKSTTSIYENINNQNIMQTQTQTQGSTTICSAPPPVIFLFITLFMTSSATAMLCAAIMTDHWEHVTWDKISLERMSNTTNNLEWMLDSKVARLAIKDHGNRGGVFLVPMHGGIWTLCIDLSEHEMRILGKSGFPRAIPCINYLAGNNDGGRGNEETRNDWQHSESQASLQPHLRMQNLSISCSLVCLIILGSAALVGAFGVCQRQISAILITGVMYLLAALFALFTLMIIHFKRQQGRPTVDSDFDSTVDGVVAVRGAAKAASSLLGARIFTTSWSLDLGWGGVVLCAITSILWILLSKIMRYNPISAFMI